MNDYEQELRENGVISVINRAVLLNLEFSIRSNGTLVIFLRKQNLLLL